MSGELIVALKVGGVLLLAAGALVMLFCWWDSARKQLGVTDEQVASAMAQVEDPPM